MADLNRRRLVRTGTLSAGVLLAAALLVIVNYFGWKYHDRFDWTSEELYTLSEKSANVLAELDRDVEIVVFLSPEQQEIYEPTRELLAQYEAASPRVSVRWVDPERNLLEAQQLVQRYGIQSTGVVVVSGDERRVIGSEELAELDFSALQFGQEPEITGYKGEQLFASAILQLTEGRKPKILFTTGHGELSLDEQGPRGLAGARQTLGEDNFEIEEWASLGKDRVPEGTDLVVIAGPTANFVEPELDVLSAYLAAGGRVLALVDPVFGQTAGSGLVATGLRQWLDGYGVRLGNDIVVDPGNPLPFFGPETIFAQDYGSHPVIEPVAQGNLPVLFSAARSAGRGEPISGLNVTELVRTTAEGWGETNVANLDDVRRDERDLAGPVPLAVAVSAEAPEAAGAAGEAGEGGLRLLVFGDSDWASNQLLQANVANTILLSNTFNWLVERQALLGVPPKKTEQVRLTLTSDEMTVLVLLVLVALPLAAVVAGVYVFFRRRR